MNKKLKQVLTAAIMLVVTIFLLFVVIRPYRNVYMEMVIFPWRWYGEDAPVYRFIIQNDGTFITYTGISIHGNVARSDIIMWPFCRRRARVNLSDEDFHRISEMTLLAAETNETSELIFWGGWQVALLYNGNIYERSKEELLDLATALAQLSPLMSQYHGSHLDFTDF